VPRKKNKEVNGIPVVAGNISSDMDKYETKRHMETLMDAEEIKADPKKMKHVQKMVKKHKKLFKSIADVKKYAQDKYGGVGGKPKMEVDIEVEEDKD
jgi:hypothetical protein